MLLRILFFFSLVASTFAPVPAFASPNIIYVRWDAAGTADGDSWANAFPNLQTALGYAVPGYEIWVAAGTYRPGTTRDDTFALKDGVALYGGFHGTETTRDQRDPAAHITMLSGDLSGNDNGNILPDEPTRAENVYHVISSGSVGETTVLDGFTITGGNANLNPGQHTARGGGMWNGSASPVLRNIIFLANTSMEIGGGMYNEGDSQPLLDHVTFQNNTSEGGGGLANYQSSPSLQSVTFQENTATFSGGGMLNASYSSPVLKDVTFNSNLAYTFGGGMSSYDSVLSISDTTFSGNFAVGLYNADHDQGQTPPYGGGMYNSSSSGTVLNSTFTGNRAGNGPAPAYGTGIGNLESSLTFTHITVSELVDGIMNNASHPVIQNSIVWVMNDSTSSFTAISDTNGSSSSVSYSVIQGGFPNGTNIVMTDPKLDTLADNGGSTKTIAIQAGSSALDQADPDHCPAADQRGAPRSSGSCDIGAYEWVLQTISGNTGTGDVTLYSDAGMVVSDSLGNYSLSVPFGWSGTIQPYRSGYRFTPTSRDYTNVQGDQTSQDFAAVPLFTISGTAGIGGALLSYEDGSSRTVKADSQGNYSFPVPYGWSGSVVPAKTDYIFVPALRNYSDVREDQAAQDYAAIQTIFTISGNVRHGGVTLRYMEDGVQKTLISSSSGDYSFKVSSGWSGTVTPSKVGVIFEPASRSYVDIKSNQTAQNYKASLLVTTLADSGPGSLRAAITSAVYGDMITFHPDLAGQTITLASALTIVKGLTINGSGLSPRIEISGNGSVKIFGVDPGFDLGGKPPDVKIQSVVLKNGKPAINIGGGNISIEDVSFAGNSADYGGAISSCCTNTSITITDSDFISNAAQNNGGAIYTTFGSLAIKSSIFSDNTAGSAGGAISIEREGPFVFEDNIFSNNTAIVGGAIQFESVENGIALRRNLFRENIASSSGGAISEIFTSPSFLVENNTFYANQANNGGAVLLNSTASLKNNTFSDNRATQNGASLYLGHAYLYNNILANSRGGDECYINNYGWVHGINNLVEGTSANCAATFTGDPMLGPLADQGGPVQTMALLPGSPAIDAGDDANCPAADQRGIERPQGSHCDLGAFEYVLPQTPTETIITGDSPDPSELEGWVTVEVQVKNIGGAAGQPTGIVHISGADSNCDITLSAGTGSCNVRFDTPGSKVITASYEGDADHSASSDTEDHLVTIWSTALAILSDSPDPSHRNEPFSVVVRVDGGGIGPTGTVTLTGSGGVTCTLPLTNGTGSCQLSFNTVGTKILTATYNGDSLHLPSTNVEPHTVIELIPTNTPPASPTFADVPTNHPYYGDIEILYANHMTGGCATNPLRFCPDQIMNRAQAAVFMLRGNFGQSYVPPMPTHIFKDDWTKGPWAEGWAEGMRNEGFSAGCLASPLKYCPWDQIPREQAVIFALKLKHGKLYTPPAATGTLFADMNNPGYYATSWAEQAYKDGLIQNCGMTGSKPKFCPKAMVSRGLAAYMIVRAKGLTMP